MRILRAIAHSSDYEGGLVKRPLAAAVAAAVVVGTAAAPAAAATPTQRIAKLERQVKTLQRQNRTLTTQVREAREGVSAAILFAVCSTAITADAFQGTWNVIDQVAQRTVFGGQQPVSDRAVCSSLQVPRPATAPPTINPFASLLRLINQPSWSWGLAAVFHH
jgi:hypothetical protein